MKSIYLGEWKNKDNLIKNFEIDPSIINNAEILLAYYDLGSYEGEAFVLLIRENNLYEVNASHCSCYELEGQWREEETTKQSLLHRLEKGNLGTFEYNSKKYDVFKTKLKEILDNIK